LVVERIKIMEKVTIQKPKNYKSHFTVCEGDSMLLIINLTDTVFQAQTKICDSYKEIVEESDDETSIYFTIE